MSLLECASCAFENRPDALYCGRCGAVLGQTCPSCGTLVERGLAFCTACGGRLAAGAEPALAEERKVVSVLFADLVGFTDRAEQLDPEDVRRLLAPYYGRLREELQRFGGTVEKFIGDAVVGLFGAPAGHGDDPERAVRAALAVREAIGELNHADPMLGLQVRVAVTTGEAVIDLGARPEKGEGMAAGDVVNTAARLQALAPVDGILVDEPTWRATRDAIEYRERPPVQAKGKAAAVSVWEALAPHARLGVDIAFRGRVPLVGRRHELDLLVDALRRAQRERSPELVTLVGDPGIGKSRLVLELFAAIEAQPDLVTWRQGRSLPYGHGVSLSALGEIVKAHAGILETDAADDAQKKLAEAVATALADEREVSWILEHLRPLAGLERHKMSAEEDRAEAYAAWRRFFEALAERRPLVLVFEDLHWADDALLEFVDHLVDWAIGVPLLVVATARPELLERRSDWGGGKRNAVTLSLAPLTAEETAELLARLLRGHRRDLVAASGGNPLYAEEYARMLAEHEVDGELPLPDSVQGIIAARLDSLPTEEKAVLQDGAVVGKVFWAGALVALSGADRSALDDRLRTLERREFIRRERRSSVEGEAAYAFRHVLVRDVAYAQIPRARRAEKHRLAAEWFESLAADRAEDVAETLAHHYVSALEYARLSGGEDKELSVPARLALRDAGDRASALNAFGAATRFYRSALELWPEEDSDRPLLLFSFGRSLFHSEGTGADALAHAGEELLAAGDRERAAETEVMLGELLWTQGDRDRAFEHLERARSLLADEVPSRAKTYVLANLARFRANADEFEDAIRDGFAAFQMAEELGLDELRAHTLNTLGVCRAMIGDPGGLVDLERSLEITLALSSPEAARGYTNLASMVAHVGDLPRAFDLYAAGRREAERFGEARALRWLATELVYEHYWRGAWDDALDLAGELIGDADGAPTLHAIDARLVRALVEVARGHVEEAIRDSQSALSMARSAKNPQTLIPALAADALVHFDGGRRDAAEAGAEELLDILGRTAVRLPSFWLANLAFVLASTDRRQELRTAIDPLPAMSRWLEATRAAADGDWAAAAGVFAEIGALPEEALAHLRAAEAFVRAECRDEADVELGRALEFYRRVDADVYVRRAEGLLAAAR